jgi:hypothetical protein
MRRPFGFVVFLCLVLSPWLHSASQVGRVEFVLFTSFGDSVRGKTMVAINGDGFARKLEVVGRGSVELPYGTYVVECSNPSFLKRTRLVSVSSPELEVVFGLALKSPGQVIGEGTPERWAVSGRVETKGKAQGILIKLTGVLSDFAEETETNADGRFSLGAGEIGKYFLIAIDRGEVIAQRELTIDFVGPRSMDVVLVDRR